MEGVALRWRAAIVVLQGLLAMTFLISGISALSCHSSSTVNHFTPHKGNTTVYVSAVGGIINCSSAQNVCTDAQLTLTIDKEVLIVSHKGCTSKDLKNETEFITSGDRHFAIQFNESYCFDDLCNVKTETREVPRTPIEDGAEPSGSNQCYSGFAWGPSETVQQTMTCGRGYNRCYNGTKSISVGPLFVSMIFRTCQRPACDVSESQSFGPINITRNWYFGLEGLLASDHGGCRIEMESCNSCAARTAGDDLSYFRYQLLLLGCPLVADLGGWVGTN
ncbi:Hypothetical predicted protein [Podarcis lilfordi]|uniref:UPAR/Ly6 domain-containing protein n=1 Tax=Podarcis lilfordi TaxID=74358 RepID=A0AA35KMR6_9SAUR|nr:Hypothetical predicted protein [Podarcis lilfordi]